MFNGKIHSKWPCSIAMWLFTRPGKIHALYVWPYGHTYKRSTVGTSLWQGVQVRGQLRHCLRGCWVYGYVIIIIMIIMSIQYLIHIWYIYIYAICLIYIWLCLLLWFWYSIIITTYYYYLLWFIIITIIIMYDICWWSVQ